MTTATATATLAVNAAFLQEIKDEHLRLQSTPVELIELVHEHAAKTLGLATSSGRWGSRPIRPRQPQRSSPDGLVTTAFFRFPMDGPGPSWVPNRSLPEPGR